MKNLIWSASILTLAIAGAAPAVAMEHNRSDAQLDQRIERRIAEWSGFEHENITVRVTDHVAVLTGYVRSDHDRRKAEQLAKIDGVKKVDNYLKVEREHH
jgi:osmotically-inducible protein OsmY